MKTRIFLLIISMLFVSVSAAYSQGDRILMTGDSYFATDSGSVGIGTTEPGRLLHVDGPMRLSPLADAPESPVAGDIYQDGSNLYYYDGTEWVDLTLGGGTGSGDCYWIRNGADIYR